MHKMSPAPTVVRWYLCIGGVPHVDMMVSPVSARPGPTICDHHQQVFTVQQTPVNDTGTIVINQQLQP